jgi:hypothetical protein
MRSGLSSIPDLFEFARETGAHRQRRWLGCYELVIARGRRVLNAIAGLFHLLTRAFYGIVNGFAGILCGTLLLLATGQSDKQRPYHQRGADDYG